MALGDLAWSACPMRATILINHIGYQVGAPKRALIAAAPDAGLGSFAVVRDDGRVTYDGPVRLEGEVAGWQGRNFWSADFGALDQPGRYHLRVGDLASATFEIDDALLLRRTLGAVLAYLRSQRSRDPWDDADRRCPFVGDRTDRVDVHGGWHDASGDVSKYLSHLSYANFMNPQQTPIVVYNLLWAEALLDPARHAGLRRELADEAAFGGDFLVRMQDPAGYFYMTVFDRWSKQIDEREICAYETQRGIKRDTYRSGYRQGGGLAIAALARLAAAGHHGENGSARYLEAAERGFEHLERHNLEYLDDGRENIIDDYCALLASAELYAATRRPAYADAARRRAAHLMGRLTHDEHQRDYWRADDAERPFFHAVEAGLPALALLRWAELSERDNERAALHAAVAASLSFELRITDEVANPFGYARQYVKPTNGPRRSSFFFPHVNESGYWWQGENARLGSLAAAAAQGLASGAVGNGHRRRLLAYAHDQLDWILGRNPFDACMLHGFGRNNVDYQPPDWSNAPGGICNGITAGYHDEADIDFARMVDDGDHAWRWTEQWIPHAAWYALALAALDNLADTVPPTP
jgi:hypothetical protein